MIIADRGYLKRKKTGADVLIAGIKRMKWTIEFWQGMPKDEIWINDPNGILRVINIGSANWGINMSKKKIKKTEAVARWEGFMLKIQHETVLLCNCVQKGLMNEGMIMIKVTKDEDGKAVVDVGLAVPDEIADKIDAEREANKH